MQRYKKTTSLPQRLKKVLLGLFNFLSYPPGKPYYCIAIYYPELEATTCNSDKIERGLL